MVPPLSGAPRDGLSLQLAGTNSSRATELVQRERERERVFIHSTRMVEGGKDGGEGREGMPVFELHLGGKLLGAVVVGGKEGGAGREGMPVFELHLGGKLLGEAVGSARTSELDNTWNFTRPDEIRDVRQLDKARTFVQRCPLRDIMLDGRICISACHSLL
jgi:hypothetical protein